MIDSVEFLFAGVSIDRVSLTDWAYSKRAVRKGKYWLHKYEYTASVNSAPIVFTYFPAAKQGKPYLKIRFSLPHLLFGNNYTPLYDLDWGIRQANNLIPAVSRIPKVDLRKGILTRLDICYDFQVGERISDFIWTLHYLEYPRRKTKPYTSEGVMFENGEATIKFYDKSRQLREELKDFNGAGITCGRLRLELMCGPRYIRRILKEMKPTFAHVTLDLLVSALEECLNELSLSGTIISTEQTAYEQLVQKFGEQKGLQHYQTLCLKMLNRSKDAIAKIIEKDKKTVSRRLTEIISAGVALTLIPTEVDLPQFILDRVLVHSNVEDQKKLYRSNGGLYGS